jgi:hypothetical protein
MQVRYQHSLAVQTAPGDVSVAFLHTSRVRGSGRLTGHNTLRGQSRLDALDANGNILPEPQAVDLAFEAVRMAVTPI